MKPIKEQIKEFWKRCGITWKNEGGCFAAYQDKELIIYLTDTILKDGVWHKRTLLDVLPIDLNNLFKYAVPKVQEMGYGVLLCDYCSKPPFNCELYSYDTDHEQPASTAKDNDPALALFWAIWEIIK